MNYGFGQALLDSLVGIAVVFFALVLLMCIIKIMTAIGDSREKKNAAAAFFFSRLSPMAVMILMMHIRRTSAKNTTAIPTRESSNACPNP